ncbi:MAG: type I secretion C-terminal target domain-containing protein, partial [Cyanobacteria bacterium J06633_23]
DTIFDFEIVRDRIDLSAIFNGNASLGSNVIVQQVDNNTAILANTGSGMEQVAMLMNVTADKLDSSNFTF